MDQLEEPTTPEEPGRPDVVEAVREAPDPGDGLMNRHARRALGAGLRASWRFQVRGVGSDPGAQAGARRVFAAWSGVFRAGFAGLFVGGILVAGVASTPVQALGALLAVTGLASVVLAWLGATALAGTRPPAPHPAFDPDGSLAALSPYDADAAPVAVAPGVVVHQQALQFMGAPFGARMTVLDDGEGGQVLVSPIAATPERVEGVLAEGPIRAVVAPNALHHLFVQGWRPHAPEAAWYAPEGLPARRPDLAELTVLADDDEVRVGRDVVLAVVAGHDLHREIVAFHEPSRTLVVQDLLMGFPADTVPGPFGLGLRLAAMDGRVTPPSDLKLTLDDPEAFARGVRRLIDWAPERVILAHGDSVDVDVDVVLRDAFAFVLER